MLASKKEDLINFHMSYYSTWAVKLSVLPLNCSNQCLHGEIPIQYLLYYPKCLILQGLSPYDEGLVSVALSVHPGLSLNTKVQLSKPYGQLRGFE